MDTVVRGLVLFIACGQTSLCELKSLVSYSRTGAEEDAGGSLGLCVFIMNHD